MKNLEHFPTEKKLHTDVLEEQYGPIHSEIIRHDDVIRETHLKDSSGISRTYALTFFSFDRGDAEIVKIDSEIKQGGLIGATFRANGYTIRKNVIDVYILDLPDWLRKEFGVKSSQAKARLSEFYAKKDEQEPIIYGTVVEVYTPDFRPAEINDIDTAQINPTTAMFEREGISKQQIWERLGEASRTDEWSDVQEKFDAALVASKPSVQDVHQKIETYVTKE